MPHSCQGCKKITSSQTCQKNQLISIKSLTVSHNMNSTPTIQFENETTYHCLGDYDEDDVLCNNFTFTKNVATSPTTRTLFSVLVWSMLAFTCVLWYLCIRKERPERTTRGPFIKYFRQSGCQMVSFYFYNLAKTKCDLTTLVQFTQFLAFTESYEARHSEM